MDFSAICDTCLGEREFCINCNTPLKNKISFCIDGLHYCGLCKDKMDRMKLLIKK